jgi:hypothetical protein
MTGQLQNVSQKRSCRNTGYNLLFYFPPKMLVRRRCRATSPAIEMELHNLASVYRRWLSSNSVFSSQSHFPSSFYHFSLSVRHCRGSFFHFSISFYHYVSTFYRYPNSLYRFSSSFLCFPFSFYHFSSSGRHFPFAFYYSRLSFCHFSFAFYHSCLSCYHFPFTVNDFSSSKYGSLSLFRYFFM